MMIGSSTTHVVCELRIWCRIYHRLEWKPKLSYLYSKCLLHNEPLAKSDKNTCVIGWLFYEFNFLYEFCSLFLYFWFLLSFCRCRPFLFDRPLRSRSVILHRILFFSFSSCAVSFLWFIVSSNRSAQTIGNHRRREKTTESHRKIERESRR